MPIRSNNTLQIENLSKTFNSKIVIVTGELSGEIHALHLIEAIRESIDVEFSGIGSKKLEEAGVHVVYDYRSISLTGISEIFLKLKYIRQAYNAITKHIMSIHPSLVILVDFPGFNLRIARFAKKHGIPVIYFIPPQIWAWRKQRIHQIKKFVDRVICVLPFEKKLYDEYGIHATYVGHPFVNIVKPTYTRSDFIKRIGIREGLPVITIMPGSRDNEIVKHMPILLKVIEKLKEHVKELTVLLPIAENMEYHTIKKFQGEEKHILPLKGLTYDALFHSDIAIIASGSATLEAAILGVPTIVVYKVSRISYLLGKLLVKVKYISLPNIIAGKEVFPEFVQHVNPEVIAEKAIYMLKNGRDGIKREIDGVLSNIGTYDSYELAKKTVIAFLEDRYGTLS
ncbi:MAG: lipid-A-disaccharide synthase [Proteobacteria bacterium]|nr:lipid-A-disaccharide synthase [Pseudomonadota bacterium]